MSRWAFRIVLLIMLLVFALMFMRMARTLTMLQNERTATAPKTSK